MSAKQQPDIVELIEWRCRAELANGIDHATVLQDVMAGLRRLPSCLRVWDHAAEITAALSAHGFSEAEVDSAFAVENAAVATAEARGEAEAEARWQSDEPLDEKPDPTVQPFVLDNLQNRGQGKLLLESVYPPGGLFFLQWMKGKQGTPQANRDWPMAFINGPSPVVIDGQTVGGVDRALDFAQQQAVAGRNVYLSTAAFRHPVGEKFDKKTGRSLGMKGDRTKANAASVRVLVADIDVRKDKGYASIDLARGELIRVIRQCDLPEPSFIIHSGSGLHVWWLLDEVLSPEAWKPLARKFAELLEQAGLQFDSQCTKNVSGVLRLPGTANCKRSDARMVHFLEINLGPGGRLERSLATIRGAIETNVGAIPPPRVPRAVAGDETRWTPASDLPLRSFCGQVTASLVTGGAGDDYSIWFSLMSIARFCKNGSQLAHDVSNSWPGYDPATVEEKLAQVEYPTSCQKFEEIRPGPCLACRSRGTIGTPLQLDHNRQFVMSAVEKALYEEARDVFFQNLETFGPRIALGRVLTRMLDRAQKQVAAAIVPKLVALAAYRGADADDLATFAGEFLDQDEAAELAERAAAKALKESTDAD